MFLPIEGWKPCYLVLVLQSDCLFMMPPLHSDLFDEFQSRGASQNPSFGYKNENFVS